MGRATCSTAPILATCGKCGEEGIIIANPSPKGSFQCVCSVPAIVRPVLEQAIAKTRQGAI